MAAAPLTPPASARQRLQQLALAALTLVKQRAWVVCQRVAWPLLTPPSAVTQLLLLLLSPALLPLVQLQLQCRRREEDLQVATALMLPLVLVLARRYQQSPWLVALRWK